MQQHIKNGKILVIMNLETISLILVVFFGVTCIYFYFSWMVRYAHLKSVNVFDLINKGIIKPYLISQSKGVTKEHRKKLNKRFVFFYLFFFLAFIFTVITTLPLFKDAA